MRRPGWPRGHPVRRNPRQPTSRALGRVRVALRDDRRGLRGPHDGRRGLSQWSCAAQGQDRTSVLRSRDGRSGGRGPPRTPVDSGDSPLSNPRFFHACPRLRRPSRPAQRRDHRPRRPRQDHARRRHALAVRRLHRAPGRRGVGQRAGHGLDGPRAREGHHDPREEHRGPLPARPRATSLINIIDTPGHADFGGEVERGLAMVDGVLLLVDASEGPLPQTRFVLRKALQKQAARRSWSSTRSTGRTPASPRSSTRPTSCSSTSTPTSDQIDFPIVYASAKAGRASLTRPDGRRRCRTATTSSRCSRRCSTTVPAPSYDDGAPLQAHVTNLDASPYLGRLALCRVHNGDDPQGPAGRVVPRRRHDRAGQAHRAARAPRRSSGCRPRRPAPATSSPSPASPRSPSARRSPTPRTRARCRSSPSTSPAISMTIGINTSPLAGRERQEAHRPAGEEPARRRARRQRLDPGAADRAARHLGGAGPRRAAARDPRRDHAPRGLRAHRRQAAGRHPRRSTARCTSRWSG